MFSRILVPCLLFLAGCGGPSIPEGGPDAVVLIVIDTLRADYLGSYGYPQESSPNLDRLAARGVRFDDVTSTAPVTLPSVTSILTGLIPPTHGVRDNAGFTLAPEHETLPERFATAGWRTGAVVSSAVLSADRGLDQGFEIYADEFGGDYPVFDPSLEPLRDQLAADRRRADRTTDLALEIVEDFGDQPYFLLVHYFDVHEYYDPPPDHGGLFPGNPYTGEIHFVDSEISRLLDAIESARDPLVIVVSDHGEGLGEHGEVGHGFLLHQATIRVPLIVAGPGIPAGQVRHDPVSTIDIEAGIAASAGLAGTSAPREGRLLDWAGPADSDPPAFYAETMRPLLSYGWSHLRALRHDEFKLVEGPSDEFFDLSNDPGELAPIDDSEHPRATAMRSVLRGIADGDDPEVLLAAQDPDPQRLETLASLGYTGGALQQGGSRPSGREYWRPHPASKLAEWNERQRNRPRYRRAIGLLEAGEFEAAVAELDTFLTVEPRHASALYNRGLALRQLGRAEDASASILSALEADPDYVPALRVHARGLVQRGDFAGALPYLQDLAQLEGDDPGAQYNLGVCALKVSRPDIARDALRRFLEVAPPGDRRVPAVRQTLTQLR